MKTRMHFGMARRASVLAWACVGLLLLGQGILRAAPDSNSSAAHKVRIKPWLASEVANAGGKFIADYGTFQVFELDHLPSNLATNADLEVHDEFNRIHLNSGHLDTTQPAVKAMRRTLAPFTGQRLHLVHFAGPVSARWRDELAATGVRIISYLPENAYIVYGDAPALNRLQAWAAKAAHVQWEGPYESSLKLHPRARALNKAGQAIEPATDFFSVQLVTDSNANAATLALLQTLALESFSIHSSQLGYQNITARFRPGDLPQIAAQPDVVSIHPHFTPQMHGERQDQIVAGNLTGNVPSGPGYLAWLASKGFTQAQFNTSGFLVDVSDSGIDNGTTSPNHFGLYTFGARTNASRVRFTRLEGTPNSGSTLSGCDGHGNLNAHIIGGYDDLPGFPFADSAGFHYGLGVCPFVKMGSSVVFDPDYFTSPDYAVLQSQAYQSGARISNNSWGGSASGDYDSDAQAYDALVRDAQPGGSTYPTPGNQEMVLVFSSGNDGPSLFSLGSPGSAKNVITVGASENVQAFGGADGSGITDSQADSANDLLSFSSRGPCSDGRMKPDLVAPGSHISGGVPQTASPGQNGTANPCFLSNGDGVSGGPNRSLFFPANQQFYTASSGTSHAAPCVSGACALLRQYFINQFTNPPSPAMTKAYLVNSTRYLTGNGANDTLWSSGQGMGELNLGTAFDGLPRFLRDELPADLFTATGQSRTFTATVANTNQPFRVTLAWTDAPGSTAGDAYNNNLDLTVTVGGQVYKGNVFSHQFSIPGGSSDTRNNVESVFLPAGTAGPIAITVTAADINSDGVPNNSTPLDQDFALVAYNANVLSAPVVAGESWTLLGESYSPTNSAVEPGETVTIDFSLENVGTADTTNLVATLLPTGGVSAPSAPQTYGILPAQGSPVSRAFTFTATGACGTMLTAILKLQDGAAPLGWVAFNIPLGQLVFETNLVQDFDAVTPPSLPSDWGTTNTGAGLAWVTSSASSDTPPNAAFGGEPDVPGIGELISPPLQLTYSNAQLSFRQDYDLEADSSSSASTYDGGVLEIQIGSAPFKDILDAGGSFVTGGYNRTIDPSDDNPLVGRQAWGGDSAGFIQTVVNLPASVAGQNVQFKWRLATDTGNDFGGSGWFIDSITLTESHYTCPAPGIYLSAARLPGGAVALSFQTTTNASYTVQYKDSLSATTWNTLQTLTGTGSNVTITNTPPGSQRYFRVRSP